MGAREKNGARKSVIFTDLHNLTLFARPREAPRTKYNRSQSRVDVA